MEQWPYWVERITPSIEGGQQFKTSCVNTALNELDRDGWELVNVIQIQPQVLLAFFKQKLVI